MLTIRTTTPPRLIMYPKAVNVPPRTISQHFCIFNDLHGIEKTYDANNEIFGEGAPADLIYKVVRGTVRNCRSLRNGRRKIDAFRLPGDIFGFDTANAREYSAEAVDDVSVIVARRCAFVKKTSIHGDTSHESWTAGELRRVQEHTLLLVKNARQRVASFLLEMYRRATDAEVLHLSMSRNDIADYLGLTVETVSRAITQFEASGVIELQMSRQIVLHDPCALRALSE
jgi:CRP/FNR family nitrogen fixation transcriptional regulator